MDTVVNPQQSSIIPPPHPRDGTPREREEWTRISTDKISKHWPPETQAKWARAVAWPFVSDPTFQDTSGQMRLKLSTGEITELDYMEWQASWSISARMALEPEHARLGVPVKIEQKPPRKDQGSEAEISSGEKIYRLLESFLDSGLDAHPSAQWIAKKTELSTATANRMKKKLRDQGLINWTIDPEEGFCRYEILQAWPE